MWFLTCKNSGKIFLCELVNNPTSRPESIVIWPRKIKQSTGSVQCLHLTVDLWLKQTWEVGDRTETKVMNVRI